MSSTGENRGTNNSQAWQAGRTNGQSRDRQQPASTGVNFVSQAARQEVSSPSTSRQDRGQSQGNRTLNAQQTHGGGHPHTSRREIPQHGCIWSSDGSSARQQYSTRTNGAARQFEPSTTASNSESRSSPRAADHQPSGSSDRRGTTNSYSMQRYLAETQRSEGGDEPWKMVNSFRYPSGQTDQNVRTGRRH